MSDVSYHSDLSWYVSDCTVILFLHVKFLFIDIHGKHSCIVYRIKCESSHQ